MIAFDRGVVSRGAGEANRGGMAAVGLGRDDVTGYLIPGSVLIGCENSPSSVTLTGDKDALDGVLENIRRDHPDVFVRALRVNTAYHSRKCLHVLLEDSSCLTANCRPHESGRIPISVVAW